MFGRLHPRGPAGGASGEFQNGAALQLALKADQAETIAVEVSVDSEERLFRCPAADPTELRSHVSVANVAVADTDFVDFTGAFVGITAFYPLYRGQGVLTGGTWQLNLQAGILSQFNLDQPSDDLLNTDFLVGFPVTYRYGDFSLRTRLMHQSSHLGDELLLSEDAPRRVNLSFEFVDLILSQEMGDWRVYGGGAYLINRQPSTLKRWEGQAGLEYRDDLLDSFPGALLVAVDYRAREETDWKSQVGGKIGWDVSWNVGPRTIRFDLVLQGYEGPLPFGQFFTVDTAYYGIGMDIEA